MAWQRAWTRWGRAARRLAIEVHVPYLACRDPRVSWYAKLLAGAVVAYALSPLDLIPDFIPVLGYLDDLILLPLGVLLVRWMIPEVVMVECRQGAESAASHGKPASRLGAAIVIGLSGIGLIMAAAAIVRVGRPLWPAR